MKIILLLISITLVIHSSNSIVKHIEFEDVTKSLEELTENLDVSTLEDKINHSIDMYELQHARNLITIARIRNIDINEPYFITRLEVKESLFNLTIHNSNSFYNGFIKGKGDDIYGISGSIASDFLVIGDIRTLSNELNKSKQDQNKLNITLSSLGIALTAGTVMSAGTLGFSKFWVSFFKVGKSSKLINNKLSISLYNRINNAINLKKIKSGTFNNIINKKGISLLNKDLKYLNLSYQNIGSRVGTLKSMQYMNATSDFKSLNTISTKYKSLTPTILKLAGRTALITTKVIKFTTKLLLDLIELIISIFIFVFSRKL
jgi:hypothetical protein